MAVPYTFSRDAKVSTNVDLAAAGREDVEGQHSNVAPIGMQNKATLSSKLNCGKKEKKMFFHTVYISKYLLRVLWTLEQYETLIVPIIINEVDRNRKCLCTR